MPVNVLDRYTMPYIFLGYCNRVLSQQALIHFNAGEDDVNYIWFIRMGTVAHLKFNLK